MEVFSLQKQLWSDVWTDEIPRGFLVISSLQTETFGGSF